MGGSSAAPRSIIDWGTKTGPVGPMNDEGCVIQLPDWTGPELTFPVTLPVTARADLTTCPVVLI